MFTITSHTLPLELRALAFRVAPYCYFAVPNRDRLRTAKLQIYGERKIWTGRRPLGLRTNAKVRSLSLDRSRESDDCELWSIAATSVNG